MATTPKNEHHPSAYQRMMERVHVALDKATHSNFALSLEHAKEKAVHLGELSQEEAERIAHFLQRDVVDVARYLGETGNELSAWFHFDLAQLEQRWFTMLASVADRTRVELAELAQQAESVNLEATYLSGETTGPGTLQCKACENKMDFYQPELIPVCAHCQGTVFLRVEEEQEEE